MAEVPWWVAGLGSVAGLLGVLRGVVSWGGPLAVELDSQGVVLAEGAMLVVGPRVTVVGWDQSSSIPQSPR